MAPRDGRRVEVAAPPEGASARPPGPRSRTVVPPSAPPTARADANGKGPRSRPSSKARQRPSARRIAAIAAIVVLVLLVGGFAFASWQFSRVDRVDLGDTLASGGTQNVLIVGSDTREGVSADDVNAGAILGVEDPSAPSRSDTMLLLRMGDGGDRMLSIPRDLLVTISGTGERQRINAAYNGGPQRLVQTISDNLGIPVHRYMEVDFVSFRDLVDALGGVTVDFPHPAFDPGSGLNIQESGSVELSGDDALAYVRARTYTEIIDGRNVVDRTGDIGRTQRQQQFLSAVLDKFSSTYNPIRFLRATDALGDGLRVDDEMTLWDAMAFYWRFRSADLETTSLPVRNVRTSSGAAVLELEAGAEEILATFR